MAVSLICLAFGWGYELFSFGVYSNYMIYAFVFPLVGGAAFWLWVGTTRRGLRWNKTFVKSQAAAIAAWTVGSMFKGVLDIYGTSSGRTAVYWAAGAVFAAAAAAALLAANVRRR